MTPVEAKLIVDQSNFLITQADLINKLLLALVVAVLFSTLALASWAYQMYKFGKIIKEARKSERR